MHPKKVAEVREWLQKANTALQVGLPPDPRRRRGWIQRRSQAAQTVHSLVVVSGICDTRASGSLGVSRGAGGEMVAGRGWAGASEFENLSRVMERGARVPSLARSRSSPTAERTSYSRSSTVPSASDSSSSLMTRARRE